MDVENKIDKLEAKFEIKMDNLNTKLDVLNTRINQLILGLACGFIVIGIGFYTIIYTLKTDMDNIIKEQAAGFRRDIDMNLRIIDTIEKANNEKFVIVKKSSDLTDEKLNKIGNIQEDILKRLGKIKGIYLD